jgi:hypothetical protein
MSHGSVTRPAACGGWGNLLKEWLAPLTDVVFKALVFALLLAAVLGLGPLIARNINPEAMKGCEDKHSFVYCLIDDWDRR